MGEIIKFITGIFPPNNPDPAHNAWQRAVSVYVIIIGVVMLANTMLMWGVIPALFSGFATHAAEQSTQHLLKEIRVTQLENLLQGYRVQQCIAQTEQNGSALNLATANLREKGTLYWQLTGRVYVPEPCDVLLIARR